MSGSNSSLALKGTIKTLVGATRGGRESTYDNGDKSVNQIIILRLHLHHARHPVLCSNSCAPKVYTIYDPCQTKVQLRLAYIHELGSQSAGQKPMQFRDLLDCLNVLRSMVTSSGVSVNSLPSTVTTAEL